MAKFKKSAVIAQVMTNGDKKPFIFGTSSVTLTDKQLRATLGGYDYNPPGTCGAINNSGAVKCCVSKNTALKHVESGGRWCCDSCGSTDYCGGFSIFC